MPGKLKNKSKPGSAKNRGWLKQGLVIYGAIGVALYYLQKKLIFHPTRLAPGYKFKFGIPFKEINLPFNTNDNLNIIRFRPENATPKGVVLYFHGNHDNVNRYARYAPKFVKHGYEIWIADYPGYGKSTGRLTEENLYRQADEIYRLARAEFEEESIILYGKSLGSGIASYLASAKNSGQLILETPYYSIPDLFRHYAPFYPVKFMSHFKLPTGKYLTQTQLPVTIFHGKRDRVIPYRCAAKLKQFLKPGDEFITVEKGAHNNLYEFEIFHQKLDWALSH